MAIEQDNFQRYSRQIFMEEVGVEGQRKIMSTKVLVIGAGGLGSPIIQYLAAAGIGKLGIVDHDFVELHNLNRQVIHQEQDVGKPKVHSAARFVEAIHANLQYEVYSTRLEEELADSIFPLYDIIVDATDNFDTRYLINDSSVKWNKPLVYGSIQSFEGQLTVFNYQGSKNLRDLFPRSTDDSNLPTCDRLGVLGPLAGMIGNMMALQVLKLAIGLPVESNKLTLIDSLHWNFITVDY